MRPVKKLYFVRHGLTDMNVAGLVSGRAEANLTAEGRAQAVVAGQSIKQHGPAIDLIIASPARRTMETARLIADQIGYPCSRIATDTRLLERNFGMLENTDFQEFLNTHEYRDVDEVPGAETIEQLQERAEKAFAYLKALQQDNILVVGHGAFGRALRRAANGEPFVHEYTNPFVQIKNAEILELA